MQIILIENFPSASLWKTVVDHDEDEGIYYVVSYLLHLARWIRYSNITSAWDTCGGIWILFLSFHRAKKLLSEWRHWCAGRQQLAFDCDCRNNTYVAWPQHSGSINWLMITETQGLLSQVYRTWGKSTPISLLTHMNNQSLYDNIHIPEPF